MADEYRSLMARYQAGDAAAFESLYRQLAPDLRRLALRGQHASAADDVVQEVFIELHEARRSYDPRKPFEPWLMAIVGHVMDARERRRTKRGAFGGFLGRLVAPTVTRASAARRGEAPVPERGAPAVR